MADLIDREAVLQAIEVAQASLMINDSAMGEINRKYFKGLAWAHRVVDDAPTAVVLCKDCKNYGDEYFCPLRSLADYTDPNDYCSMGERRGNDG